MEQVLGKGNFSCILGIGLVVLFISTSCSAFSSSEEISRITSPDSVVDAVLVEVNGGCNN